MSWAICPETTQKDNPSPSILGHSPYSRRSKPSTKEDDAVKGDSRRHTKREVRKQRCAQRVPTCSGQLEGARGRCEGAKAGVETAHAVDMPCGLSRAAHSPASGCRLRQATEEGVGKGEKPKELKAQPGQLSRPTTPSAEALPPLGLCLLHLFWKPRRFVVGFPGTGTAH